jgi:ornithine carbamoyltransferase
MKGLRGRDLLGLKDLSGQEILHLLDLAAAIKRGDERGKPLDGRYLGMLFTVPSTRTRISFQVAAHQLGGHAEHYAPDQLQLKNHESLVDTAEVMNRYLDGLIVRLYDLSRYGDGRRSLELLAERIDGPVINALDDKEHPCQVLADVLTVQERFGAAFRDKKVVLTWAWAERQKSPGVTHSWLCAAAQLGMRLTVACPPGFEPDAEYLRFAEDASRESGATVELAHDLDEAAAGADVIYAKSWMSLRGGREEDAALRRDLRHWRVARRHFESANPEAVFMDCMPLIRGDEADADVVDGVWSIRYDEAENRLHAQKAVLAALLGG